MNFLKVKIMEYGLLSYNTENIGDDIQSIATEQFLPKVDYFVPRDNMSKIKEKCKIIMNGWFMHKPVRFKQDHRLSFDFPPKNNFEPLFVSTHLIDDSLIDVEYFKKHEPIGCRDLSTLELFKSKGIDAYFSGCLTLTLKRPNIKRTDNVYCVDCEGDGIHLTHETNEKDYFKRKEIALGLLEKYAGAKKVVTSRLHCYLPCRAFGTPVEYVGVLNKRTESLIGLSDAEIISLNLNNRKIINDFIGGV